METMVVKQRMIEKFILMEFAKGNLNDEESVNEMVCLIQSKLNMTVEQAGDFLRNAIR